jgi:hypothetical protein
LVRGVAVTPCTHTEAQMTRLPTVHTDSMPVSLREKAA